MLGLFFMNQLSYDFTVQIHALRFDFLSIGKNIIAKSVAYRKTDVPDFYSLSLVDIYPDGTFDDLSVPDNGDMQKILVTVFHTLAIFFKTHPDAIVFFEGSTPSRTRLYRIALSHELANINQLYNVWGITDKGYEPFKKNQPYIGFLLSMKGTNIA